MSGAAIRLFCWQGERARLGPWEPGSSVAYLSPAAGGAGLSTRFVRRCLAELASLGYRQVVTGALARAEQEGFLRAGFQVGERLCVLARPLRERPPAVPRPPGVVVSPGGDRAAALELDAAAFGPGRHLGASGLDEALSATARARLYQAALAEPRVPVGYAVVGLGGGEGFVQRLAVHPNHQRAGVGTALVTEALRWLARWRAARALVNTQPDNQPALALYERLGFVRQPDGLAVLSARL
ncbi:MAG TPA: GNAT family N-acetyltransferase [Acidimicrobiales bacterium]|nr:GNAT family N-acetyltransferase [Acidimicrobiales bacterium]